MKCLWPPSKEADVRLRRFAVLLGLALSSVLAFEARAAELAGTSWQLVKISSMDDSVYLPEDPSNYRLDLQAGGKAVIKADCQRAMGSWTSDSDGRLSFGALASTRAHCGPDSLSEKYLAQFAWVRSYVMEEGHLFLATMADGSILEFAPGCD